MAAPEWLSPELYDGLVKAFIELGPRYSAVAKRCRVSPAVAKRVWERGYRDAPYAAPVSQVYASVLERRRPETHSGGRSELAISTEPGNVSAPTELVSPEKAAINATMSEMQLLAAFRENLTGAVHVSGALIGGLSKLADAVTESMILTSQNVAALTPDKLLRPLEKFARITGLLTSSAKQVFELQRLVLGTPQSIAETRVSGNGDPGDVSERLQRFGRMLDMMKRSGLIEGEVINPEASQDAASETEDPSLVRSVPR